MEMPVNKLKRAIRDGKPQIGIWSSFSSHIVAVGADTGMLVRRADALAAKFKT